MDFGEDRLEEEEEENKNYHYFNTLFTLKLVNSFMFSIG